MELLEENTQMIALFLAWLYQGEIELSNTEQRLEALYDLYIFADKICKVRLMDQTIDAIQNTHDAYDRFLEPKLFAHVCQNTTNNSKLRAWATHLFVYSLRKPADNKPTTSDLWEVARDDEDLFCEAPKMVGDNSLSNIRERHEGNYCVFHSHEKDESCHRAKTFYKWEDNEISLKMNKRKFFAVMADKARRAPLLESPEKQLKRKREVYEILPGQNNYTQSLNIYGMLPPPFFKM